MNLCSYEFTQLWKVSEMGQDFSSHFSLAPVTLSSFNPKLHTRSECFVSFLSELITVTLVLYDIT